MHACAHAGKTNAFYIYYRHTHTCSRAQGPIHCVLYVICMNVLITYTKIHFYYTSKSLYLPISVDSSSIAVAAPASIFSVNKISGKSEGNICVYR